MGTLKKENDWVYMEIRDKSYFHISYKPKTNLTLDAAKYIIEDAVKLADGAIYPVLSDINNMPPHDKEVRDFFAAQTSDISIANAILVSNSFSKILANFFLTLNRPIIPTKMFTDEAKAVKWLKMFPVKVKAVKV